MSELSKAAGDRIVAALERPIHQPEAAATGRVCGDCRLWMTSRCPKETHSNSTGRWTGPSSNFVACVKWQIRLTQRLGAGP